MHSQRQQTPDKKLHRTVILSVLFRVRLTKDRPLPSFCWLRAKLRVLLHLRIPPNFATYCFRYYNYARLQDFRTRSSPLGEWHQMDAIILIRWLASRNAAFLGNAAS